MSQHLPVIAIKEAIKAFEKAGWTVVLGRGKGSHTVMKKADMRVFLTLPKHDPIKRGTLRSLIRNAEMSVDEFRQLL